MRQELLKQCVAGYIEAFALIFAGFCKIWTSNLTAGIGLVGAALASGHWNNRLVYRASPLRV